MELKSKQKEVAHTLDMRFNRTFMELKLGKDSGCKGRAFARFNRTFMELKSGRTGARCACG